MEGVSLELLQKKHYILRWNDFVIILHIILIQTLKHHCPFFKQNNSDLHSLTPQNQKKMFHLHSLNLQYALFSRYDSHSLILHCFLPQTLSSLKVYCFLQTSSYKLFEYWKYVNNCYTIHLLKTVKAVIPYRLTS